MDLLHGNSVYACRSFVETPLEVKPLSERSEQIVTECLCAIPRRIAIMITTAERNTRCIGNKCLPGTVDIEMQTGNEYSDT